MSRLGKQPVELPKGVEFKLEGDLVTVKGPKGQLELRIQKKVALKQVDTQVLFSLSDEKDTNTKFVGLYRTLVNNMVVGVTEGFTKILELKGVGYRAAVTGNLIDMQLGFSHPTKIEIPKGIEVKVEKNVTVTITGSDKQLVGQFAATLHHMRKPEPYKGKGVHYQGQYVRRKAGKSGSKK